MKNCTICGKPCKKKGRTEHYGCRCVKDFKKQGDNVAVTKRKTAFKTMIQFPNVFRKLFTP